MKKAFIFILLQFYFLVSFTGKMKAQKTDTVFDIYTYQAYIDTAYKYINYYRYNTFQEVMRMNPTMLESDKYFNEKKELISEIITKYGFPGIVNVLIYKFTLFIDVEHQRSTSIAINFIFPLADRNEKKDSISIQIICDSNKVRPLSININDYRKIEKTREELSNLK